MPVISFATMSDFAEFIGVNDRRYVRVWLYNLRSERVRKLDLRPNSEWGGLGSLGCDVVQGYLHVIPHRRKNAWLEEEQMDDIVQSLSMVSPVNVKNG